MYVRNRMLAAVSVVVLAAALSACNNDEDSGTGAGSATATSAAADGSVDVTLQEFAVSVVPATAPAGEVTFTITNIGPDDVHEFVVVKTDLEPTDLPTVASGAVDEEGEGIEPVDEVEDIPVGKTETLTVNLEAGNYVLFCNIEEKEGGEVISHYHNGMRTAFTVT